MITLEQYIAEFNLVKEDLDEDFLRVAQIELNNINKGKKVEGSILLDVSYRKEHPYTLEEHLELYDVNIEELTPEELNNARTEVEDINRGNLLLDSTLDRVNYRLHMKHLR